MILAANYIMLSSSYEIQLKIDLEEYCRIRYRLRTVMSEESVEYNHTREFNTPLNRAIYLGRYILLDPGMKDKGYFGHMGKMNSGMFTGSILPIR